MSKANRKRARKLWFRIGARCHTCTAWVPAGSPDLHVIEVHDPSTGRSAVVATCTACKPDDEPADSQQEGGRGHDATHLTL